MIVIVLYFVLRLVLFLGEWIAEIDIGIYPLSTSQVEGWLIIYPCGCCAVQVSFKRRQIPLASLHASYLAEQWQLIAFIRSRGIGEPLPMLRQVILSLTFEQYPEMIGHGAAVSECMGSKWANVALQV